MLILLGAGLIVEVVIIQTAMMIGIRAVQYYPVLCIYHSLKVYLYVVEQQHKLTKKD